ncbi:MAG: NAD(P)H-dependent oxidoreductase [Clostridia bacterium]|nr:NAD(P)H-dependent oxidoreductase [Clostridia bacterium]
MKNILVLNGSPRGLRGNTNVLVETFLKGYSALEPVQVDHVVLKDADVHQCCGCFSCWKKTPGQCVFKDDMVMLLENYKNADIIIWATPLYHYGMTAILKKFVERTLPLFKPDIVQIGGAYTHPERYVLKEKKNVLITNCGFPERHNFDAMVTSVKEIVNGELDAEILCVMGELLSVKPLRGRIQWYLDAVTTAGREMAAMNALSAETARALEKPLVAVEDFVEMANASWSADGGAGDARVELEKGQVPVLSVGYDFLTLMKHSFNPQNAEGMSAILEIEFTDLSETHHFEIDRGTCRLIKGPSENYTTKIITTYEVWRQISDGELDGAQAMMDGKYKVNGSLEFMMKMGGIFDGSENEDNRSQTTKNTQSIEKNSKVLGIAGEKWMSVLFVVWMVSWIGINFNALIGAWIPLVLSVTVLVVKRGTGMTTRFEKGSCLYFFILSMLDLLGIAILGVNGVVLNYLAIGAIWGLSLFENHTLTSEYSKYNFEGSPDNVIFKRTNQHLTLFWCILFILQGAVVMMLYQMHLYQFAPTLYILIWGALKFTNWYSKWYPERVMRGGH